MGLELVEIVMEVEDKFGITILEEEAPTLVGMGPLHAYVLRKLAERDGRGCLSAFVFYRLRQALIDCLSLDRREVFPRRPLCELIPARRQRAIWARIEKASRLDMPALQNPSWAKSLIFGGLITIVGILAFVIACLIVWGLGSSSGHMILLTLPLLLLWMILCESAISRFRHIPTRLQTVGDWTLAVVERNFGDEQKRAQTWTPAQVWEKLQAIVSGVTGLKPERITLQSTWRDLRI